MLGPLYAGVNESNMVPGFPEPTAWERMDLRPVMVIKSAEGAVRGRGSAGS